MLSRNIGNLSIEQWFVAGNDTALDAENECFGHTTWNSNVLNRQNMLILPTTLRNYMVFCSLNNNTVDGASVRIRVSDDQFATSSDGNQILTLDQATGIFQDTTNIDVFAIFDSVNMQYLQGDNNAQFRAITIEAAHR